MANVKSNEKLDVETCYRCGDSLDRAHWVRLSTVNCGELAAAYRDSDRQFCPDCIAAIGMMEIDISVHKDLEGRRRDRLLPIR